MCFKNSTFAHCNLIGHKYPRFTGIWLAACAYVNVFSRYNNTKYLHNTPQDIVTHSHPAWNELCAAAAALEKSLQVSTVATFCTYVSWVDGPQAAEDVMKLWGSWLQVWEVLRPSSSQPFPTVKLQCKIKFKLRSQHCKIKFKLCYCLVSLFLCDFYS